MPRFLAVLLLLAPLASAQDVLVILADDVAQADIDQLEREGAIPNLTALANSGIRYLNACANPTCSPSRRSLHFSRWHFRDSGIACLPAQPGLEPPLADISLADLALEAGLVPGLFGKWHLGSNPTGGPWEATPIEHGYRWWQGTPANLELCGGTDYKRWVYVDGGFSPAQISLVYEPRVIEDDLLQWWSQARGPKLALFSSSLAHAPFHRPPADFLPPGYPATRSVRAQYEAMIVALDRQIGRTLAQVDLKRTLVIFLGDNGTPSRTAPDPLRAKGTTFERGIRVPFFMAGSGIRPGVSTRLVHIVDILPTVADYLGVPAPAGIDGVSLFAPARRGYVICGVETGADTDVCARTERWKLRRFGVAPSFSEELYNLAVDPDERNPLPPDRYPAVARALRALLDAAMP